MILDTFETAFRADDIPVSVTYSFDSESVITKKIQDAIENSTDRVAFFMEQGVDIDPKLSEYRDAEGLIVHSRCFLLTFAEQSKACSTNAVDWLKKIYKTSNGELGPFPKEFEYQNLLKIWRFHPTGGVIKVAAKTGSFWSIAQPIEFAAREL